MKTKKIDSIIAKLQGKKRCFYCGKWYDPRKNEIEYFSGTDYEEGYFEGGWICYHCQDKAIYEAELAEDLRREAEYEAEMEARQRYEEAEMEARQRYEDENPEEEYYSDVAEKLKL